MTEHQQFVGALTERRIRERLAALRKIAHRTMVTISTMDEKAVYEVLVRRKMPNRVETGTQQAALDNFRILNSLAETDGIMELLEAGGIIPVTRCGHYTEGHSLALAGNLKESDEKDKVGPAIVNDDFLQSKIKPSEVHLEKLSEDWVRKSWPISGSGSAHHLIHSLSSFKPKRLLYRLVESLK